MIVSTVVLSSGQGNSYAVFKNLGQSSVKLFCCIDVSLLVNKTPTPANVCCVHLFELSYQSAEEEVKIRFWIQ